MLGFLGDCQTVKGLKKRKKKEAHDLVLNFARLRLEREDVRAQSGGCHLHFPTDPVGVRAMLSVLCKSDVCRTLSSHIGGTGDEYRLLPMP